MFKKKALVSILTVLSIVTAIFNFSSFNLYAAAPFEAGAVVQAEDGVLANDMQIQNSKTASGGKAIGVPKAPRLDDPSTLPQPDARYSFNVTQSGEYKIYMRYNSADSAKDSFHYRFDDADYRQKSCTIGMDWNWLELPAVSMSPGVHTFDITHREAGVYIDLLILTQELTEEQKSNIENSIIYDNKPTSPPAAANSKAVTFDASDGSAIIEAEDITIDEANYQIVSESYASGGKAIAAASGKKEVLASETGAEFNVNIDKTARYSVWVRYSAITGGEDSMFLSADGGEYSHTGLPITGDSREDYGWKRIYQGTAAFEEGTKHNFRFYPRETNNRIDKIIVTSHSTFIPTGMGDKSIEPTTLPADVHPLPTITPPPTHPRLLFTPSHIEEIKANMTKPQNATAYENFKRFLDSNIDGNVGSIIVDGASTYNSQLLVTIESFAFDYAINGNIESGNKAISCIKNFLETVLFSPKAQDVTRPMGHTIFAAAEVYDWCYPLLSEEDKLYIIEKCESIAGGMEVGWPPSQQNAVVGHAGEAQLLRDLLGFSIATYDERPDMYNFIAGRLLSDFLAPRNLWYRSHTHHQGTSYGGYRFTWEMVFLNIMQQLSGEQVFTDDAQYVPYQWLYIRRPDGRVFRRGDSYRIGGGEQGKYWSDYREALFYTASSFDNPYIKYELLKQNPGLNAFTNTHGQLTPVIVLILNNPDFEGKSYTELPLSKYFASPYGMMVARTGWTEQIDYNSNIAMAEMSIGELWAANHHHLDFGTFQLYYKGILALDSGIYDLYGTDHDYNYNKETIAHNSLLIFDPNENTARVNSGGQRRPGGEMKNMSAWLPNQNDLYAPENNYIMGKVLGHEYDTENKVPQYSYIKGDISRAYSDKVEKPGGVLRSMVFMPLDDQNHPAALIVMDKVTSTNPSFKKTWLVHTQQEPVISGNTAYVLRDTGDYNGRMDLTTLLPLDAQLTKIGGEGSEYIAGGQNWKPLNDSGDIGESGAWRIEVSPGSANKTDYFLNVMQVSDADKNAAPLECELIENNSIAGVKIKNRAAIFAKDAQRLKNSFTFTISGNDNNLKIFVAGVKEGTWTITANGTNIVKTATADGGVLFFDGAAGEYTLTPGGTPPKPGDNNSNGDNNGGSGTPTPPPTPTPSKQPDLRPIDIEEVSWAKDYILDVISKGIMKGYEEGGQYSFRPNNNTTRAEFATALFNYLNLSKDATSVFEDTKDHWAKDYISKLVDMGILNGTNESSFAPDDYITREQIAAILNRAFDPATVADEFKYTDNSFISDWAADSVYAVRSAGWMSGDASGTFRPKDTATRAEIATILSRLAADNVK